MPLKLIWIILLLSHNVFSQEFLDTIPKLKKNQFGIVLSNHIYNITSKYRNFEHSLSIFQKRKEYFFGIGYAVIFNAEDDNRKPNKIILNGISGNFGFDFYKSKNNKFIIPVTLFCNYYRHNYIREINAKAKLIYLTMGVKIGLEYKPLKQNIFIYTYAGIVNLYRRDEYIETGGKKYGSRVFGLTTAFDIGLKYYFGKHLGNKNIF